MEQIVGVVRHNDQVAPPGVQLVCAREADGFSVTQWSRARRTYAVGCAEPSSVFSGIIVRQRDGEILYSPI